ncbi:glycine oxidase ThiO [soil metagenome]
MRVAIIGGGVMGTSTALALADRGIQSVVLERAVPGAEASSAAAGILGAQVESDEPSAHFDALRAARDAFAAFADRLRDETSIDVGYKKCGVLAVAFTDATVAMLRARVAWQSIAGCRASFFAPEAARTIEPELAENLRGAAHFPDDAQVEPPALLRALVSAIHRRPEVEVRSGVVVRGLDLEGGACRGVLTDEGVLGADAVVLAAGSWSELVPGYPIEMGTVKPVRGQLAQLEERPPRLRSILFGEGGYVVPRWDGRVVCGATMEHVGFRREVTGGGLHAVLETAIRLAPRLAEAQFTSTWSSFRPWAKVPLVGASPVARLFLATGHHRNGILLCERTGLAVATAIAESR